MRLIFTFLLFAAATICFAQKKNTYFITNDGSYVSTLDSADFIRIVSEPDQGSALYNVNDYYKSGKRKLVSKSTTIIPVTFQEQVIESFENEKRKRVSIYKDGILTGDEYSFFPNGKVYVHKKNETISGKELRTQTLIISNYDSLGTALVTDGNGKFIGYDDDFKQIVEEGMVKNGQRDGEWKGMDDKIKFVENYKDGRLVLGRATNELGEVKSYTERKTPPMINGRKDGFEKYLLQNLRYPREDSEDGGQINVNITVDIENNGTITNLKTLTPLSAAMKKELMSVMAASPKWMPATQFGIPVRYANFPVSVIITLVGFSIRRF
jgi:antitoxin component YwqK of YwqJK toxin-antitoxin module